MGRQYDAILSAAVGTSADVIEIRCINAMEKFRSDFLAIYKKNYEKIIRSSWNVTGKSLREIEIKSEAGDELNKYIQKFLKNNMKKRLDEVFDTTEEKIKRIVKRESVRSSEDDGIIKSDNIKKGLRESLDITAGRARTIARTETAITVSAAEKEAMGNIEIDDDEVMLKTWNWNPSEFGREGENGGADHSAMNGVTIPIDEKFYVNGPNGEEEMDGPADSTASASQVVNCTCFLTYEVVTKKS